MDPQPTIRQLAAWAGLSPATISLALRNHPSIPAVTRERIHLLAQEKGYRIDPLVATLMAQLRSTRVKRATEKIAMLTFWSGPDDWRENINNRAYFEGAKARAYQLGYEIEAFWGKDPSVSQSRLSRILHTRGIRGVIASPLPQARGHVSLEWEHFASSSIGYTVVQPIPRIAHAHYNGMQLALRTLKRYGYRRVGYASLQAEANRVNRIWLGSYLAHHFDPDHPGEMIPPLLQRAVNKAEFAAWLQRYRPDAIVSNLPQFRFFLEELGYPVPEKVGYASLDAAANVDVAGIDQLPEQLGVAAVDMVVRQIQNNEFGLPRHPILHLVDGVWRDGASIRHLT